MTLQALNDEIPVHERPFAPRKSLLVLMSAGLLMGMISFIASAFRFGPLLMMRLANGLEHGWCLAIGWDTLWLISFFVLWSELEVRTSS